MQVSHSRIETFKKCAYQYKLRYVDKLKTYFNNDPANPLIIGTALHTGIEVSIDKAIDWYYAQYPIINDQNIEEAIKLEYVVKKCKEILPEGGQFELKIECPEFVGYIDYLVPVAENTYDLYDFKYSNNVANYLESGQLHEYKFYFEKLNPTKHIRNMYFLFAPKVAIKMKYKNKTNKRDETLEEFRRRLKAELSTKSAQLVQVEYDYTKVVDFLTNAKQCRMAQKFDKNVTNLCDWCEYKKYCFTNGKDDLEIMNLPKNERRNVQAVTSKKIWFYGAPFSGKTYLANQFPDVLMLNTDGNIKYVDAPFIAIKDIVTVEGRRTIRTLAWQVFKDAITELEKKQNDFKTIVVDLLEDTYEYCRLFMYDQLGITHESDDSFKAWDKVRIEFLSTIKRLMNLDYENIILISHEDTSKDLTKKGGDKVTAIKPNLQDKAALKIAGMVDLVARIIDDEGKRVISFKTNEVIFGGGRLGITTDEIPCSYDALMKVYRDVEANAPKHPVAEVRETPKTPSSDVEVATANPQGETPEAPTRKVRTRVVVEPKAEEAEEVNVEVVEPKVEEPKEEPLPTRKVRTRTEPTEHEKKVEEFRAEHTTQTTEGVTEVKPQAPKRVRKVRGA